MHNDEAVNGIKFGQLWGHDGYQYDRNEHHGPSLPYATLALSHLTGAPRDFDQFTEGRLRFTTVLIGIGLILLLPLVADGLGKNATLWAGLFTAVSPAVVFYSRYYIHEILLVFFTLLALAAGWRYWRSRKIGWALLAGAGVGLMHGTKETFLITVVAAALALGLNQLWNRWLDATVPPAKAHRLSLTHLAAALGVWLGVALLLFSSFFTNGAGPLDSVADAARHRLVLKRSGRGGRRRWPLLLQLLRLQGGNRPSATAMRRTPPRTPLRTAGWADRPVPAPRRGGPAPGRARRTRRVRSA